MSKSFRVLDTSALVHDPNILLSYPNDSLYVCLTVLEELDNIKSKKDKTSATEARMAIRMLEEIINGYGAEELHNGVPIPSKVKDSTAKLHVIVDSALEIDKRISPELRSDPDNRIINVALDLMKKMPDEKVSVVSRDINLRLKARTLGANSEDVPDEIKLDDMNLLYSGTYHVEGNIFDLIEQDSDFNICNSKGDVYRLPRSFFGPDAQKNLYWFDDNENMGRIIEDEGDEKVIVELINKNRPACWGIRAKNIRQSIAFHQLTSQDYDLNILLGPAGSGKTLLALAAALHMVIEEKRYKRIICVRSKDLMDDDIGHLPGTEAEKVAPLLGGITDSLMALHRDDEDAEDSIKEAHRLGKIEMVSLAYMRGRSISDAVIIFDEAQNTTRAQVRGLLSRAHSSSRVIMLANIHQIDSKFITPLTSGASTAVNTYRHYEGCATMIFDKVERSKLAEFTENNY